MAVSLAEAKRFLRVDDDVDNAMIKGFIDAAEKFLSAAVGDDCDLNDPRAQLLVLDAVRDMYDGGELNRTVSANTEKLFNSFALQLRTEAGADVSEKQN